MINGKRNIESAEEWATDFSSPYLNRILFYHHISCIMHRQAVILWVFVRVATAVYEANPE